MQKILFDIAYECLNEISVFGAKDCYDDFILKKAMDDDVLEKIMKEGFQNDEFFSISLINENDQSRYVVDMIDERLNLPPMPRKVMNELDIQGVIDTIKYQGNLLICGDYYIVACSHSHQCAISYCLELDDDETFDKSRLCAINDMDWEFCDEVFPISFSTMYNGCGRIVSTLYYQSEKQGWIPVDGIETIGIGENKVTFVPLQVSLTDSNLIPLGDWCDSKESMIGKISDGLNV